METIGDLDVQEFAEFLENQNMHEDVITAFLRNRVCGSSFLSLTEEDFKELLPIIGDRVRVRKLFKEATQVSVWSLFG